MAVYPNLPHCFSASALVDVKEFVLQGLFGTDYSLLRKKRLPTSMQTC